MEKTPFAGITRLDPGEPLSTDGFAFQGIDRAIIDRLLRIGAVTHRHDAHAALVQDPTPLDPTVAVLDTGGTIPADTAIYVGYTLLDADGGETVLNANPQIVTTQAGLAVPADAPTLTPDTTAGTLLADNYYYAITVTDGLGGETAIGPSATVTIPPGNANNQIVISGLLALVGGSGGTGWRLWRMIGSGTWSLLASGAADTFTDDGVTCADCSATPPATTGRTNATNRLQVTVPAGQPADAVSFNIYGSLDGSFQSPCLLGTYPIADAGTVKEYTALDLLPGAPPVVATALPGANQITEADIGGLNWRPPVANAAALPALGNVTGDVRLTLDDFHLHAWGGDDAWHDIVGGGGLGSTDKTLYSGTWPPAAGESYRFVDGLGAPVLEIYAEEATPGDPTTVELKFAFIADGIPLPIANENGVILPAQTVGENPTTWGSGWAAYATGDGVNFWPDLALNVHFEGQAAKTTGTAPVAGEVIFSLPAAYNNIEPTKPYYPVVTGDADGLQLGIVTVEWNGTNYDVVWQAGKSTDPATKSPFVALDGIVVRMNP